MECPRADQQPGSEFFFFPDTNAYFVHQEGKSFMDAVFNETINITESDEGIDGET